MGGTTLGRRRGPTQAELSLELEHSGDPRGSLTSQAGLGTAQTWPLQPAQSPLRGLGEVWPQVVPLAGWLLDTWPSERLCVSGVGVEGWEGVFMGTELQFGQRERSGGG